MTHHDPADCEGRPCCIHNPSDHHMKDWPQHWRPDRYLMERTCEHGIGHPDPDHVAYMKSVGKWEEADATHGCDGCCNAPQGGFQPHLTFDNDNKDYVLGWEAGSLWQRMENDGGALAQTLHTENAEMVIRMCEKLGREFRGEELGDGWMEVYIGPGEAPWEGTRQEDREA